MELVVLENLDKEVRRYLPNLLCETDCW